MTSQTIASTCKECYVGCGAVIEVESGRVTKITGNPEHPHSRGAFCIKGVNAPTGLRDHPDRLLYPLRRVGGRGRDSFARVSWEEATEEIAQRLGAIKKQFGSRSIAGAVSNQSYDRGVAMSLLIRSIGSPNYMINQDLCHGCRVTAAILTGVAAQAGSELQRAGCILSVGKSSSDSNVIEWRNIKHAKQNGAKLIVVDPRHTQSARAADLWLPLKPGTDAALALSMIEVILRERLHDHEFVEHWCVGTEELRKRAERYDPARAAAITGIPENRIVDAARLFATCKPGCMVLGHGIDAQANGVYTAIAFSALLAITGNIDRKGTNRLPRSLPGFRDYFSITDDPQFQMPPERERDIIGGQEYPFWSGPRSWAKACHNPSVIQAMLTGKPYPVRALYASGVNIVCTYPGMQDTIAALKSLDLLVVATDSMTPTAELADFVLPKTVQLEEEAVITEPEGPCLSVMQRAVPPLGEAKTDFEIAIALRDALRRNRSIDFELLPWNTHREFIDFQLRDTGLTFDELCTKGFHEYPVDYEVYRSRGFNTPSGKVELASSLLRDGGYDPLPDYHPPGYAELDADFNLILITGIRSMAFHHSRFRNQEWARKILSGPEVRVHRATAKNMGIADGDWVFLETRGGTGRIMQKARLSDDIPENVVTTGMGWWFPEVPAEDHGALAVNVEAAIAYGPRWDPITGSAEARNVACRIARVEPGSVPQWLLSATESRRRVSLN